MAHQQMAQMQYEIVKLEAENAALKEQLAAAQKDAARLDWLELNPRQAEIVVDGERQPCLYYAVAGAFGVKLRAIIDAAIAKEKEK